MWFSFHLHLFQPFSFEIRKTATIRIVWLHTGQQWVDPPKDQLLYTTSFRRTVEVIQAPVQTGSGGLRQPGASWRHIVITAEDKNA